MIPLFRILDIIELSRERSRYVTANKGCYVLSCRMRGAAHFAWHDGEEIARRGDVLYIPYGASYTQETEGETIVCFHLEAYCELSSAMQLCRHERGEEVCAAFLAAVSDWRAREAGYEARCMARLYEILALCGIELCRPEGEHGALRGALAYLDAHLCDTELSIGQLCASVGMSRTYFYRLFKAAFDCTPSEYVSRMRVQKACALLRSGNYTTEEIAQLCGYRDVKYFYTTFKRQMGQTTREYRAGM